MTQIDLSNLADVRRLLARHRRECATDPGPRPAMAGSRRVERYLVALVRALKENRDLRRQLREKL